MSKEMITEEKVICDLCHSSMARIIGKCIICKRDFCWRCEPSLYNIYNIDVCKECFKKYEEIFMKWLEKWRSDRKLLEKEILK